MGIGRERLGDEEEVDNDLQVPETLSRIGRNSGHVGELACMILEDNIRSGRSVDIPSLGISINQSNLKSEDSAEK